MTMAMTMAIQAMDRSIAVALSPRFDFDKSLK